jgi:hypothetical protein
MPLIEREWFMGEVMEKCPPGLYITQTPCTINAVRRIFSAGIPDAYFIADEGLGKPYSDD